MRISCIAGEDKFPERGNLAQERVGKFKKYNNVLNFPSLDILILEDNKEWEIQKYFCHSLPYFSIYILPE